MKNLLFCLVVIIFTGCANKNIQSTEKTSTYSYGELKLMEPDEVDNLTANLIERYKNTNSQRYLFEAFSVVLSRPDDDGVLSSTLSNLKQGFDSEELYNEILSKFVDKNIEALSQPETSPVDQVNSLTALSNVVLEFKSVYENQKVNQTSLEATLLKRIASKKIVVSKEARDEMVLNSMSTVISPSELAQNLINKKQKK